MGRTTLWFAVTGANLFDGSVTISGNLADTTGANLFDGSVTISGNLADTCMP